MATIYSILGSSLLAEWAADQPTTIYEDTGGTDQAEDGDGVAAWRTTGNGTLSLLATQSTVGSRPAYRSNYSASGYPAVEFDGADDGLIIPHHSAFDVTKLLVFVVAKADTLSAWRMLWSRVNNGSWLLGPHLAVYSATDLYFVIDNVAAGCVVKPGTSNKNIFCGRYNLISQSLFRNATVATGGERTAAMGTHSVGGGIGNGGAGGGNYPWDGPIFHLMICDNTPDFSMTAIEQIMYLLSQRWGISYTQPPSYGGGGKFEPVGTAGGF